MPELLLLLLLFSKLDHAQEMSHAIDMITKKFTTKKITVESALTLSTLATKILKLNQPMFQLQFIQSPEQKQDSNK